MAPRKSLHPARLESSSSAPRSLPTPTAPRWILKSGGASLAPQHQQPPEVTKRFTWPFTCSRARTRPPTPARPRLEERPGARS